MKNKSENPLPKMLPGSVHGQFVRCGKPACRCARGELHGPYFYHFERVGGRLVKRYLKAGEIEQTRAACAARRGEHRARLALTREAWRLIRNVRARLRDSSKSLAQATGD
jgi:hypothetical protein